jgi:hypothetical protein
MVARARLQMSARAWAARLWYLLMSSWDAWPGRVIAATSKLSREDDGRGGLREAAHNGVSSSRLVPLRPVCSAKAVPAKTVPPGRLASGDRSAAVFLAPDAALSVAGQIIDRRKTADALASAVHRPRRPACARRMQWPLTEWPKYRPIRFVEAEGRPSRL